MKRLRLCLLCLILALTAFTSCGAARRHSDYFFDCFDTVTELVGYTRSEERFDEVREEVHSLLSELHREFDIYNTYGELINLAAVNATAGEEKREFSVSKNIYELLTLGKEVYALTDGKVNIAMGSVLSLWHECRTKDESPALPERNALLAAAEHTDIESLELKRTDGEEYLLTVTDRYLTLDVGALAKGYAAQKATEYLSNICVEGESFMLNLGGMVCPVGAKPDGDPWVAGIEYPTAERREGYLRNAELSDGSLVTAAAHLRAFAVDGKSYGHIIDSETLYPPEFFAAVTVYCDDPALGDALSTALFCMTEVEGRELAARMGVHVMWVYSDMTVSMTDGFSKICN